VKDTNTLKNCITYSTFSSSAKLCFSNRAVIIKQYTIAKPERRKR